MFRVCYDGAEIVGLAQSIRGAADSEELALAGDCRSTIAEVFRTFIRCIEDSERQFPRSSRQLASPGWIDDLASVYPGSHVTVAAGARDVEESHSFHEERALFGKEIRETLIHLNLKGIAFHLTEVGIDRGIQRN